MSSGPFLGLNNEGSDWDAPITRFDWRPTQMFYGVGSPDTNGTFWASSVHAFDEDEISFENGEGLWQFHAIANVKSWRIQGTISHDGETPIPFDSTIATGQILRVDDDDTGITNTTTGTARTVRNWQFQGSDVFCGLNFFFDRASPFQTAKVQIAFDVVPRILQPFQDATLTKAVWGSGFNGLFTTVFPATQSKFGRAGTTPSAQSNWTFLGREIHGEVGSLQTITLAITAASYYDDTEWE